MVHPALVVHPQKSQHLESRLSYNIYDVRDEIDIRILHTYIYLRKRNRKPQYSD